MSSSEEHSRLVAEIRKELGKVQGIVVWQVVQGRATPPGGSHPVPFGLAPGASDLVGIAAPTGRWFAIEVKTGGARPSASQSAFLALVERMGGVAGVARSVDDAERIAASAMLCVDDCWLPPWAKTRGINVKKRENSARQPSRTTDDSRKNRDHQRRV